MKKGFLFLLRLITLSVMFFSFSAIADCPDGGGGVAGFTYWTCPGQEQYCYASGQPHASLDGACEGGTNPTIYDPVTGLPVGTAPGRYSESPFGEMRDNVIGGAVVVALGFLAGLAALVGAPVLAAVSVATAVVVGIMTAVGMASSGTPGTAHEAIANAPISINIIPASSVPPAPTVSDTSPPSIVVNPDTGQFVPGGGNLNGGGATGGWSSGASGSWEYTPPSTASNPSPLPTVKIDDGGYSVLEVDGGGASSSGKSLYIKRGTDGGLSVTHAARIPGTTPTGADTTVDAAVTTLYDPDGAKIPGSGESPEFSPVYGNGDPVISGGFQPCVVTATETCGATTTSGTDPTGTGSCTSGDCSTESTQLANKGLLQGIKDLLTDIKGFFTAPFTPESTGTTPGEQAAAENKKVTDMLDDSVGSYNNFKLLDWSTWVPQLPATGCTPFTGHVMGKPITIDICAKVAMLNELIGWLLSVFALWSVVSMLFRKD